MVFAKILFLIAFALFCGFCVLFFFRIKNSKERKIQDQNDDLREPLNKSNDDSSYTNLTFDELVELSWQFLYRITEAVLNKFSREDRRIVIENGYILFKCGVRYVHVTVMPKNEGQKAIALQQQSQTKQEISK